LTRCRISATSARKQQTSLQDGITQKSGEANRFIYAGRGRLLQASYFVGNWEPSVRFAHTIPDRAIWGEQDALDQKLSTLAITRYLNRHRIKLQGEVTRNSSFDPSVKLRSRNFIFRLNSEIGI
jgi:hypothetical protein